MMRSRLVAAAVALGTAVGWPAAALAQIMPEGHPPGEHPWALAHTYVWHDAGGWHLRVTTEGQFHQFSGWVDSPSGIRGVVPVVPGTPLSVSWRLIQYNIGLQGGENGFDWQQAAPCAQFSLLQDGRQQPGWIDVGAYAGHPPSYAPFQLCSGGAGPPPVAQGYGAPPQQAEGYGAPPPSAEPSPPEAQPVDVETPLGPEMDPDAFQQVLAPYGNWIDVPPYGTVWQPSPAVVGPDFVPYTHGHWVYSDAGWVWSSDYPWGWAPFHYGNWIWAAGGWCWVPGRVWAPAWVSWRYGDGIVGWAPIGPGGEVEHVHYVFCEPRYMMERRWGAHLIRGDRAIAYERRAPVIASIRYEHGRAVVPTHAGPPPHDIERATGRSIHPVAMKELSRRAMPPANTRGVHYAAGASASHPFVKQTVHAAPAAHAGGGARPENRPLNNRSSEGGGTYSTYHAAEPPGEQHPQERPMERAPAQTRPEEERPAEARPMEQQQRPMERPAAQEHP
ncbi:MAG TPA: DUF6600 domain-containing protein, partial [Myxococcales bacterium]|nr:DUF6600 domain-containing protein [Myxococcales bacterium]